MWTVDNVMMGGIHIRRMLIHQLGKWIELSRRTLREPSRGIEWVLTNTVTSGYPSGVWCFKFI